MKRVSKTLRGLSKEEALLNPRRKMVPALNLESRKEGRKRRERLTLLW